MRSLSIAISPKRVLFLMVAYSLSSLTLYGQLTTANSPRFHRIILGHNSTDSLLLVNSGNEPINWTLVNSFDWLKPEQNSGSIQPNDSFVLPIKLKTDSLPLASYQDTLHVSSSDSASSFSIPIIIQLATDSHLALDSDTLIQSLRVDEIKPLYFDMRNLGKTNLDYRLFSEISLNWLKIESSVYGILMPKSNRMMSVMIDARKKTPGNYLGKIWITSNDEKSPRKTVWVKMVVLPEAATVKLDLPDYHLCAGEVVEMSYEVVGTELNPFNVFQVELSDAYGDFNHSRMLADIQADAQNGQLSIHIPEDIAPGDGYQLRINASSPPLKGKTFPQKIRIAEKPQLQFTQIPALCPQENPYELTEAKPVGGRYVGEGISGNLLSTAELPAGMHNVLYEYTSPEGCDAIILQEVEVLPDLHVTHGKIRTFCENEVGAYIRSGTPQNGRYEGNGVRADGYFDPRIAGAGVHQLKYIVSNGSCEETVVLSVTVFPAPSPKVPDIILTKGSPELDLNHANKIGGVFLGEVVKEGKVNPQSLLAGEYPITYYYTSEDGCIVTSQAKVIIEEQLR